MQTLEYQEAARKGKRYEEALQVLTERSVVCIVKLKKTRVKHM